MTTKRHSLTASEHQEVQIYIKNTNLSYLNPHYKQMFEGIVGRIEDLGDNPSTWRLFVQGWGIPSVEIRNKTKMFHFL